MITLQDSSNERPYTAVTINGTETSALVDTAATIALIENQFIPPEELAEIEAERARILGLGGHREYPITRLDSMQAGTETWSDLRVAVNPINRFPVEQSVLPITVFDTRVVDFDFSNQRVLLYDSVPKRIRGGYKATLDYENVHNLMFVNVRINGAPGKALVDTGADVSFVNPRYAELSKSRLDEKRTKIIQGSDLAKHWASIRSFRRLEVGDHEFDRLTLPVVATDLFTELGFGDEPIMVLGMDLLHQFRVQVDREQSRINFVHIPARRDSVYVRLTR